MTGDGRDSADNSRDPLSFETTQSADRLLAFLRADPLDVYNGLTGDVLAFVMGRHQAYQADADAADDLSDVARDRLLTAAAVDAYRQQYGSLALLCAATIDDPDANDLPDGVPAGDVDLSEEDRAAVLSALADLVDRQQNRLRRLGIYPVDTDDDAATEGEQDAQ